MVPQFCEIDFFHVISCFCDDCLLLLLSMTPPCSLFVAASQSIHCRCPERLEGDPNRTVVRLANVIWKNTVSGIFFKHWTFRFLQNQEIQHSHVYSHYKIPEIKVCHHWVHLWLYCRIL